MEEQKNRKFNVLDVIFLLVAAAGICFLAFRLWSLNRPLTVDEPEDYYVVTFTSDSVSNYVLDHLRVGAAAANDNMSCDLGTVVDVQLAPSLYYSKDGSGNWVNASRKDSQSLKLMCAVKGSSHEDTFIVDGISLSVGGYMVVRAEEAKMYLMLYSVEKLSETSYSIPEAVQ